MNLSDVSVIREYRWYRILCKILRRPQFARNATDDGQHAKRDIDSLGRKWQRREGDSVAQASKQKKKEKKKRRMAVTR